LLNYHDHELTPDDLVEIVKQGALEPDTVKRVVAVSSLTEGLG